jgi:CRISPR-associated endonuclease/helicase Cas3
VYPLIWHLLDTAAVAWCVWDVYMSGPQREAFARGLDLDPDRPEDLERARRLLACWAGWHDLGKITDLFQRKDSLAFSRLSGYPRRSPDDPRASHGWATHLALAGVLPGRGYDAEGRDLGLVSAAHRIAQVLGGHHGRFFEQPRRREVRHPAIRGRWLGAGRWEEQRLAHLAAVASVTGDPVPPTRVRVTAAVLAAQVVVLADWLASQDDFVVGQLEASRPQAGEPDIAGHWARTLTAAPGLLLGAGLGLPQWEATPLS